MANLAGMQSVVNLPHTATTVPVEMDPIIRDYDNLFRLFYNYPPLLNSVNIATAYAECRSLLALADMYDALAVTGPRVDHHLLGFGSRLFKQIAKYPPSYLKLGPRAQPGHLLRGTDPRCGPVARGSTAPSQRLVLAAPELGSRHHRGQSRGSRRPQGARRLETSAVDAHHLPRRASHPYQRISRLARRLPVPPVARGQHHSSAGSDSQERLDERSARRRRKHQR